MLIYPALASNPFRSAIEKHSDCDKELNQLLIDSGLFAFAISRADGRIISSSPEAESLFGRGRITGLPVHQVIASTHEVSFCTTLAAALERKNDRILTEIAFRRGSLTFHAMVTTFSRGDSIVVAIDYASVRVNDSQ